MRARHVGAGGASVRAQRIASAKTLASLVKEHCVDAVFVAGDVFEDNAVDSIDIERVVDACTSFGVPTYVLPGNHDPLTTGSVWGHGSWSGAHNVFVLRESQPLSIGSGITLYPCPATTKMSSADPTAWISGASVEGTRLGIAHGTVMNAVVAEDCFPIRPDAASACGLDYLALGHWHSFASYEGTEESARMAYSGTHEATKFGERLSGNVLIVDIPGRGAMPRLKRIATGALQWLQLSREIGSAIDLERLIREVEDIPNSAQTLVELRLSGVIAPSLLRLLGQLRDRVAVRFPLLGRIDESALTPAPDDDAWADALPAGLLREVARDIRAGGSESAARALMLLYGLGVKCGEVPV